MPGSYQSQYRRINSLADKYEQTEKLTRPEVDELVSLWIELDEYLSNGGGLPDEWEDGR
jgi:hypothetical protein